MAVKRKAHEAFSKSRQQTTTKRSFPSISVSAFAAAKARVQDGGTEKGINTEHDAAESSSLDRQSQFRVPQPTTQVELPCSLDTGTDLSTIAQLEPDTPLAAPRRSIDSPLANLKLNNKVTSYAQDKTVEVALSQDEFVTPIGEYDLEVPSGTVALYGAMVSARSGRQRVYALATHALPHIVAKSPGTAIRLFSVHSYAKDLQRFSPLFRNIATPDGSECSFALHARGSEDSLQRSLIPLETTKQHQVLLTQLAMKSETKHGRISVACVGGKSTGKSTLARHICNKLLTRTSHDRCFFLDLDPGQPEFGPPGQVYLVEVLAPIFGPSYTHFASRTSSKYRLIAAHTIAATSFKDDSQHYMDCVTALSNDKRLRSAKKIGNCPIVVNTCGWVTGLGARLLCDILDLGITDTVLIDTVDSSVLDAATAKSEHTYKLDRPTVRISSRSPAEMRQMQVMAYFHTRSGSSDQDLHQVRLSRKSIAQWRPWIVSYNEQAGSISAIVTYGQGPNPDFLREVIDGSIVALVTTSLDVDDQEIRSEEQGRIRRTPEGLPYLHNGHPLDPRVSEYHGLALVRGIDPVAKQIHLLTPLAQEEVAVVMQKTVVLVRGGFDSPDWAYLEDIHDRGAADHGMERPWVARRDMVGVEGAVWRLRHPPIAARGVRS